MSCLASRDRKEEMRDSGKTGARGVPPCPWPVLPGTGGGGPLPPFAFSKTKRFWDEVLIFFLISSASKTWGQTLHNVSGRSLGFPGQNYKAFFLFPVVRFPSNESDPCLCTI